MAKLIVIRGPSGSGKTTIAKVIKDRSDRPTVLVEQDQYRPNFNKASPKDKLPIWEMMIDGSVTIGLKHGYDVIMEGILNVKKPGRHESFERLFQIHPEENYIFYLDISFEETVRRHKTRKDKNKQFDAEAMKDWYDLASPMGHAKEIIIPESSRLEESIQMIAKTAGLNLS